MIPTNSAGAAPIKSHCRPAFSLIELMVTIGIIAILLAIIVPVMSSAIYQAELTQCGAKVKAIAVGVTAYAGSHRRFYPDRGPLPPNWLNTFPNLESASQNGFTEVFDSRPALAQAFAIDATLNDPLTQPIALARPGPHYETMVWCSYGMWFGSGWVHYGTMRRLGDRVGKRYSILAGDIDFISTGDASDNGDVSGHPDRDGKLTNIYAENSGPTQEGGKASLSLWVNEAGLFRGSRGPLDLNYASSDGAVVRYDEVVRASDPRMVRFGNWQIPNN